MACVAGAAVVPQMMKRANSATKASAGKGAVGQKHCSARGGAAHRRRLGARAEAVAEPVPGAQDMSKEWNSLGAVCAGAFIHAPALAAAFGLAIAPVLKLSSNPVRIFL